MSEAEWLDIFSANLYERITEYGINQRELADNCDLSESSVSAYIHGRKMPGVKALINISYELGITLDELMDFDDRIE